MRLQPFSPQVMLDSNTLGIAIRLSLTASAGLSASYGVHPASWQKVNRPAAHISQARNLTPTRQTDSNDPDLHLVVDGTRVDAPPTND
jgi:hypothetical protein